MVRSKYRRILFTLIVLALTIAAISCTSTSKSQTQVTDYASLLYSLRASGRSVSEAGPVTQAFSGIQGRTVIVSGQNIQVFEYDTPAAMENDAKTISPEGTEVKKDNGILNISWIGPPHFYKVGRIIVLFVGDDKTMTNLLENILGKQFAGL